MGAIALRPRLAYGTGAGMAGNKGPHGSGGASKRQPARKGNQGGAPAFDRNTILFLAMNANFADGSYYQRAKTDAANPPLISATQSKFNGFSGQFIAANTKWTKYSEQNAACELAGDFTIEAWVWLHSRTANQTIIYLGDGAASTWGLDLYYRSISDRYVLYNALDSNFLIGSTQPTLDTWQHVQATRVGTTITLSLDGVSQGTATNSRTYGHNAAGYFTAVGAFNPTVSASEPWGALTGYMDCVRVSKTARYTSYPFTPSAIELSPYM